jgi:(+)-pinoresinol hydroxylase
MRSTMITALSGGAILGALFIALGSFGTNVATAQGSADLARGQALYEYWCLPCHASGSEFPGTQSLQVRDGGDPPAVLHERTNLTPDVVKLFVREGILSMPPFRKTEITDEELEDLAAYLSTAYRNR